MSNLDRIWKLYMAFNKTESKKGFYSAWDYYREGYCEAEAQRAALDARRAKTLKKYKERAQGAENG